MPGRLRREMNSAGDRHRVRHAPFIPLNWNSPAATRTSPPGAVSISRIIEAEANPSASSPHCRPAAPAENPAQATRYPATNAAKIAGTRAAALPRLRSAA